MTQGKKKLSDSELVQRFLATQESAYFSVLYDKYSARVYSRCLSLLKDVALAQDATQEVFVKIYLNLSKFSERSQFSTWVYSITYNFCIDLIRRNKKQQAIFTDDIEKTPEVADEVSDEDLMTMEVDRLKDVLENIPVGDKAILLMKYQDDMQIKDIAEALDKTESAIKMKLKRAKHKAQSVYQTLYPPAEY
ncbi:MAG: RNA polymerase sigma factor [Saprospirales bacterium]|nr:RNA polymerase sigma factor [Saprospirales bacterium]MBK8490062.1 RNA polymerase sigma factor [Saprospirales bacterium]